MKRVLLAVALAALLAMSLPAGAVNANATAPASNLDVGSKHTTASDFEAGTLNGLAVSGTGPDAFVHLSAVESFEDGDIAEYGGTAASKSNFSVVQNPVFDGSYALNATSDGGDAYTIADDGLPVDQGESVEYRLYLHDTSVTGLIFSQSEPTINGFKNGYLFNINENTPEANIWVTQNGSSTKLQQTNVDPPNSEWLRINVTWDEDGTLTMTGYDASGSQLYTVSATNTTFESGYLGFRTGRGNSTFDQVRGPTDWSSGGQYVSANHTVDNAQQTWANLTLDNATATVEAQAWTGSSWTVVNSSDYTSTGNYTLNVGGDYSKWRTNITVDRTGSSLTAELHDEGVLFDAQAPTATLESPSDGTQLTSSDVELVANLTDADFPTAQGDDVTVKFQTKKPGQTEFVTNTTVTTAQNRTIKESISAETSGTWEWRVVASDGYGNTFTSPAQNFTTPGTLSFRNATDPHQLIDSPVTVEVQFLSSDNVYRRNTTDGTLDMTSLPTDESFIVEVDASENYYSRTVYIQSIYAQENVFLLNSSTPTVESRFQLDDPTGQYGSNSYLFIEKPIEWNGTTSYRTVYADKFGTEGITAQLEDGARYRLRIQSPSGISQDIGPYRADVGETVTVRPGSPTIDLGEMQDGWAAAASLDNRTLEYRYSDPEQATESVTVWIHEKGDTSNQLRPNQTYFEVGSVSGQYTLTENESEKTWVVVYDVDRGDNEFQTHEEVANAVSLVPGLSREWRLITGIGVLFISAGIFSTLNAGIGGIIVSIEGGLLWWSGWLDGATTGAAVGLALFVAVIAHIYHSRGL